MQDFLGSVRRSIVFRTPSDSQEPLTNNNGVLLAGNNIVEKINSCVKRSKIFSKPTSPTLPPTPLIRYKKGELIGCGAFGQVYMGMNLDSGELLAIKQVLIATHGVSMERAQDHIRGLEEEVKLLKNLSHPNIVRYLGTVREEESLNILLEFVPGGSISSLLGKFGPFPEAVIRAYTKQLLLGLQYLHNNGIIHRDIKGANILVDNKGCIKLADFGASKQVVELATVSGAKSMKGTPFWMAPEVMMQTGHSFSADIWSLGCTVIEMATGKPPWSQYKEVATLFYHIGSSNARPEIPDHLSHEAKDFLLSCLRREPNMRPGASELVLHPFVSREQEVPYHSIRNPVVEKSPNPPTSTVTNHKSPQMHSVCDSADMCNLGSLSCSIGPCNMSTMKDVWDSKNNDEEMCQIDNDNFTKSTTNLTPFRDSVDVSKNGPKYEAFGALRSKLGENVELEQSGTKSDTAQTIEGENFSFQGEASLSEDDDEVTESKIKAFLDEKALELKKLQTPLYEQFYNSLNAACSPTFSESSRDETPPQFLKLPPKSRSPSQVPVGSPSVATDVICTGSPGSNSRRMSKVSSASDPVMEDNSSPQCSDKNGLLADAKPESSGTSVSFSEIQRKWKEELDQELERKREMMRQTGGGVKTSSPIDRSLGRQRDRTRFASPSK